VGSGSTVAIIMIHVPDASCMSGPSFFIEEMEEGPIKQIHMQTVATLMSQMMLMLSTKHLRSSVIKTGRDGMSGL
jgi:hypothetical protein